MNEETNNNLEQELDLNELMIIRREKLEKLKQNNKNPFEITKFDITHTSKEIIDNYEELEGKDVTIAGRIMAKRIMGKASFCHIQDGDGKIQSYVSINDLGEESYKQFKEDDIGDIIGITGFVFKTRTGEISIHAKEVILLSKSLRPLPEKFHGLKDTDLRYRQRSVDLIMNPEVKETFKKRSLIIKEIRNMLDEKGFMEVETPILQTIPGGASARPFITHHNTLDIDMYLRIANELYLKRLIVGGFDKVYEMGRMFRNEGMDSEHLQEFTQVEWYASYWNFEDNIKFYTGFIKALLKELVGTTEIEYQDVVLDFGKDSWNRVNYCEELERILGFDFLSIDEPDELKQKIVETGLFTYADLEDYKSMSQIIDFVYKRKIRANIVQPTIIYNYPALLIPLARRNDEDQRRIDVFQVVAAGTELCKAYSELVNPAQQRAAFEDQLKAKAQGDDETMDLDEDFLLAMEQGMPPISGLGFGIDRLMMLIYNVPSIRDVVLFPLMKPIDKEN